MNYEEKWKQLKELLWKDYQWHIENSIKEKDIHISNNIMRFANGLRSAHDYMCELEDDDMENFKNEQ